MDNDNGDDQNDAKSNYLASNAEVDEELLDDEPKPGPSGPYYDYADDEEEFSYDEFDEPMPGPSRPRTLEKTKYKMKSSVKASKLPSKKYKETDIADIQPTSSEEALALKKEVEIITKSCSKPSQYESIRKYESQYQQNYDPIEWQWPDEDSMIQAAIEASIRDLVEAKRKDGSSTEDDPDQPEAVSPQRIIRWSKKELHDMNISDDCKANLWPKHGAAENQWHKSDSHTLTEVGQIAAGDYPDSELPFNAKKDKNIPDECKSLFRRVGARENQGYKNDRDTLKEVGQSAASPADSDRRANELAELMSFSKQMESVLKAKEQEKDKKQGPSMDKKEKK